MYPCKRVLQSGKIRPYVDDVICLEAPELFHAVGQFYADFPQVSDEEVEAILRQAAANTD